MAYPPLPLIHEMRCRVCGASADSTLLHRCTGDSTLIRSALCEICTTKILKAAAAGAASATELNVCSARQIAEMLMEYA